MGGKKDKDVTGRKSVADTYESGRKSKIPAAYPNTMMVDLQVYVVPREKWVLSRRLYRHNIVEEGISLGFVRVLPQLSIHNLRRELQLQLGADLIPRDFTFIRSVGNIFVQLKPKQEMELKVKNFIPPFSTEPEIYILEVLPQEDSRMISPLPMLLREDTPPHICHDLCHHSRARKSPPMSTMNITIIIPALQLPNKNLDSPQPTTPFPPIALSPSPTPTPTLSFKSSCTTPGRMSFNYDRQQSFEGKPLLGRHQSPENILTLENSFNEDDYEDYDDDTFIPLSGSNTPTPDNEVVPEIVAEPLEEIVREASVEDSKKVLLETEQLEPLMHREEVSVTENPQMTDTNSSMDVPEKAQEGSEPSSFDASNINNNSAQAFPDAVLPDSLSLESLDTSTATTLSTSSPETVIHVLKAGKLEPQNTIFESEYRSVSAPVPTAKDILTDTDVRQTPESKPELTRQTPVREHSEEILKEIEEAKMENSSPIKPLKRSSATPVEVASHSKSPSKEESIERVTASTEITTLNSPTIKAPLRKEESIIDDSSIRKIQVDNNQGISKLEDQKGKESCTPAPPGTGTPTATSTLEAAKVSPEKEMEAPNSEQPPGNPSPTSIKPKKRLKSVKKSKPAVYASHRKPTNYPQRMNKVTLARQALAREKRRVYVEERIQNYIKSAQAHSLPLTFTQTATITETISTNDPESISTCQNDNDKDTMDDTTDKDFTTVSSSRASVGGQSQAGEDKEEELQGQRSQELQSRLSSKAPSPSSLPSISDSNHPGTPKTFSLPPPPTNLCAIPVARVPNHHRRTFKPPLASFQPLSLPSVGSTVPEISIQSGSETLKQTIIAIPSDNNSQGGQRSWKGVEHHGYFYSFRVRQSGPVQMMDKGCQTGASATESPLSQSYTLRFSETRTSSSSFVISGNALVNTLNPGLANELPKQTNPRPIDERDKILREITDTVQLRHDAELRRSELVQRANDLQTRVKEKREKINRRHEFWHKKYIEESALTRPLEASCSSLRAELNTVHRRLLAHLEGRDLPLRLRDGPSKKANYKIMAARLQHEIKELQQKVKGAKLKLDSEIKLKEQADREVREIRNDLAHKKVVMSLARSQVSTLPNVHPRYESLVY